MKTNRLQVAFLLIIVTITGLIWTEHIRLQDWWKLRGYTPPNTVSQLASDDTMNDYTRHLFYLNKPQLLPTVNGFRQHCPENKDTIVLGCYHPDQNGIYIYDVQDPTLAGIQQVTAAHEVLHAVYARLSHSARQQLNGELEDFYNHDLTDANVKSEVQLYKKTEPTAVYDEMSCTFGTEIAKLSPALESYYAQFFGNRQKIVAYEQQYQAQFNSRQQQIAQYDAQLKGMKAQIDSNQSRLTTAGSALSAQKTQMQQQLASGQIAAYNAAVDSYNAKVDAYNAGVSSLKQQIAAYNRLIDIRNSIAGQLTTLDGDIDTRLQTVPGS